MTQLAPRQMLRDGFHEVICMANGVTIAGSNNCKQSQSDQMRSVAFTSMKISYILNALDALPAHFVRIVNLSHTKIEKNVR